eukprot:gene9118-biopygen19693
MERPPTFRAAGTPFLTRPGRVRSFKFYRVGRVRDASATVSPWRCMSARTFPGGEDCQTHRNVASGMQNRVFANRAPRTVEMERQGIRWEARLLPGLIHIIRARAAARIAVRSKISRGVVCYAARSGGLQPAGDAGGRVGGTTKQPPSAKVSACFRDFPAACGRFEAAGRLFPRLAPRRALWPRRGGGNDNIRKKIPGKQF